jgi:hypothetical protein
METHGAEFVELEAVASTPHPYLAEKDWARGTDPYRQRSTQKDWQESHEAKASEQNLNPPGQALLRGGIAGR